MANSIAVCLDSAGSAASDYWFLLAWSALMAPLGLALLFDYRNLALRLERMAQAVAPGGPGRSSYRTVRVVGGFLGIPAAATLPYAVYMLIAT